MAMKKLYTENQIYIATFLGGPIPAGILIYKNLRNIGDNRTASGALLLSLIFTVLLFAGIMSLPDALLQKIPSLLFTTLYTVVVFFTYRRFLVEKINAEFTEPEQRASNWAVAGITLLGLFINIVVILSIAFVQPPYEGEKMVFGQLKHEVYYDAEDVDSYTVSELGQVLVNQDFFGFEYQMAVRLELEEDLLLVTMDVQRQFWSDGDLLIELRELKEALNSSLRRNVGIEMIHHSLSGEEEKMRI